MEEDRNWNATVRGTSHFDDEITLPLRIICERKSEAAGTDPRKEPKAKDKKAGKNSEKAHDALMKMQGKPKGKSLEAKPAHKPAPILTSISFTTKPTPTTALLVVIS